MKEVLLNKDWIPTYYCKIHHCYDCQMCKAEGYKIPTLKDDRLILTTKATFEYYIKRLIELEKIPGVALGKNHTAKDAHNLAQSTWAQKRGTEDCFDFVRRLLNELYELSTK